MFHQISDLELTDWRSLNETRTKLSTDDLKKAARNAESIYLPQQRWLVYLNSLAVLGFEKWLKERSPELNINVDDSSIWNSTYANLVPVGCNVQVDDFQVCIISEDDLTPERSIPANIFDVPNLSAHFYVLVKVEEELQEVAVSGFINYKKFQEYQQTANLPIESDWTYSVPENWFDTDANNLILNFKCLASNAIQLPQLSVNTGQNNQVSTQALKEKISRLQPRLKQQASWQLLSVAEGQEILSNSELLSLIVSQKQPENLRVKIAPKKALINVGKWLQNQADTVSQELGWMLIPSLTPSAMRYQEDFSQVRTSLEQQGIIIPKSAQGAYRDLACDSGSLRLYAIAWVNESDKEWNLIVALGSQVGKSMPQTLTLEVRDENQQLFCETLTDTSEGILYAEVIGDLDELFWINITADEKFLFEIEPFGLDME